MNDYSDVEIIRSKRRSISVEVQSDGRVVCRAPMRMSEAEIDNFLGSRRDWIEKYRSRAAERQNDAEPKLTADEIETLADAALEDIPKRAAHFAPIVGVDYGRITIRNQKSRWGSCSSNGNLNFNCLLMLCPEDVRDYVVVHELAHRKEMNHSARFWEIVESIIPDYKAKRKWLKDNGYRYIGRL